MPFSLRIHSSSHRLAAAGLIASMALVACRSTPTSEPSGAVNQPVYLCCNMHAESDWLSDGNFFVGRLIPAGTPARVTSESRGVAYLELSGQRYRLGHEYGTNQESYETFRNKFLVRDDPRAAIDASPPAVRDAIRAGQIRRGMTKQQVLYALGYPPAHGTASLNAPEWTYWYNRYVRYRVLFDAAGLVRDVDANQGVKTLVLARD